MNYQLIMEKWNRFLNEEDPTLLRENTFVRKHFNISREEWKALDKPRRQQLRDQWKQAMQKERSAQAQAQASRERSKTRSAEQPQASTPASEPSPAAAEPSPAAAKPSPAAGKEGSLDVGSGPEKALKVFMRDFLKSPLASLSKEIAQDAKYVFTEYEPGEWEDEGGSGSAYDAVLVGFTGQLLRYLNALARAHYQDGTAGAGGKYMEIREFIKEKLNPVMAHYDLPEIPDINLWVDEFDPQRHNAGFQQTAEKLAGGEYARNKVIGLDWSSSGTKVYKSIG